MLRFRFLPLILLPLLVAGCASTKTSDKDAPPPVKPAQEFFDEGQKAFDDGNYVAATKAFDEIARLHPYSDLAPKAAMQSAMAHYQHEDYDEAAIAFDQFLQLYPGHDEAAQAMYYKALCYYDQISDVTRDQDMTQKAMEGLQLVVSRYPDSAYAREATLKVDLTRDHLAGKEMEIGRWYQGQDQIQAAISRFREVVDHYQTTSHVPEALHRLVESYLSLGLMQEARETAAVLGHNYPGSPWYQDTYALLSKTPEGATAEATPAPETEKKGWFGRTFGSLF